MSQNNSHYVDYPRPYSQGGSPVRQAWLAYRDTLFAAAFTPLALVLLGVTSSSAPFHWVVLGYTSTILALLLTWRASVRAARASGRNLAVVLPATILATIIPGGIVLVILILLKRLDRSFEDAQIPMGFLGPDRESLNRAIGARGG
jgi:hypothetical protein